MLFSQFGGAGHPLFHSHLGRKTLLVVLVMNNIVDPNAVNIFPPRAAITRIYNVLEFHEAMNFQTNLINAPQDIGR